MIHYNIVDRLSIICTCKNAIVNAYLIFRLAVLLCQKKKKKKQKEQKEKSDKDRLLSEDVAANQVDCGAEARQTVNNAVKLAVEESAEARLLLAYLQWKTGKNVQSNIAMISEPHDQQGRSLTVEAGAKSTRRPGNLSLSSSSSLSSPPKMRQPATGLPTNASEQRSQKESSTCQDGVEWPETDRSHRRSLRKNDPYSRNGSGGSGGGQTNPKRSHSRRFSQPVGGGQWIAGDNGNNNPQQPPGMRMSCDEIWIEPRTRKLSGQLAERPVNNLQYAHCNASNGETRVVQLKEENDLESYV